jgi:hypothetical protein
MGRFVATLAAKGEFHYFTGGRKRTVLRNDLKTRKEASANTSAIGGSKPFFDHRTAPDAHP